ncbi:helix-turn-helix domain-containing protein [Pumilibacter intestinalis]|uniref:helix-turn-helix domain-containing protein n=1 Tax=Pumilibacter intestinalis TaxID=2941511 RepID=UPI003B84A5E9
MREDFATRLRELRIANNLSQQTIADKLHIARISYLHWEQGKTEPSINNICLLCGLFDVSADYLLGLEDEGGGKYSNSFNNFNNSGTVNIR